MGVIKYINRCLGRRDSPNREEKGADLESIRKNQKSKNKERTSYMLWILILFGLTKTIIVGVILFYLYTSLKESQDNIATLQKKMVSMEELCVQLTHYAVASRQKMDILAEQNLKEHPYEYNESDQFAHDSLQSTLDSLQPNLNRSIYNHTASNSTLQEVMDNSNSSRSSLREIEAEICKVISSVAELEEYDRLCQHFQHGRVKRSNKRGPVATHFKGGLPETFIEDSGLVAPWFPDRRASADFGLPYEFREGKGKVEVADSGLYIIYAQVYYLTSQPLNSYMINIKDKNSDSTPVAYCSTNAVVPPQGGVTEVSCFTSVIRYLNASTQVYVTQRDRNRRMILRDGYTFLGLARLNKSQEPKRRQGNRN